MRLIVDAIIKKICATGRSDRAESEEPIGIRGALWESGSTEIVHRCLISI